MIKKVTYPILSLMLCCITAIGYSQTAHSITGQWKAADKGKLLQMEIYLAKDGNYYGKVINDNSSPSKNGKLVIKNLQYNDTSKAYKGTMQPPDASVTLNLTATMENANRLKLVAKKMLMSKTIYLTRIQ